MPTRDELKDLIDRLPEEHLETIQQVLVCLLPERDAPSDFTPEVQRILTLAESVFDDKKEAALWLATPHLLFNNACPFELLKSAEGAKRVEEVLLRIAYGVYS